MFKADRVVGKNTIQYRLLDTSWQSIAQLTMSRSVVQ